MPGGTGKPLGMWSRQEVRHQWVYWQGVKPTELDSHQVSW